VNVPTAVPPPDNEFIISFFRLRQALGFIGLLLPFVLLVTHWIDGITRRPSVSAYYSTSLGDVFVGSLVAIGVFLFSYRGPDRQDNWLTNIAGACALGIALLPTRPALEGVSTACTPFLQITCEVKSFPVFHYSFAAAFFLIISYLAAFRFKIPSRPYITKQKMKRNKIYVICGIVMLLSLVAIALLKLFFAVNDIWLEETILIFTFGIAWLTKGQAILADKDKDIIAVSAA